MGSSILGRARPQTLSLVGVVRFGGVLSPLLIIMPIPKLGLDPAPIPGMCSGANVGIGGRGLASHWSLGVVGDEAAVGVLVLGMDLEEEERRLGKT